MSGCRRAATPTAITDSYYPADLGRHGLRRGSAFGSFIHLIDRSDQSANDST